MSVVVVTPSEPLVTADQARVGAPVLAGDDDAALEALLAVAQTAIETAPWLGASLGRRTLEMRLSCWPTLFSSSRRLPYGPALSIAQVDYTDADGASQTLAGTVYDLADAGTGRARLVLRSGQSWPAAADAWDAVRVLYEAGHEDDDPKLAAARHAIILSAVQLRSLSQQDLALRSIDVPGVSNRTWTVSDAAEKLVRNAVERLLEGFRIYAI